MPPKVYTLRVAVRAGEPQNVRRPGTTKMRAKTLTWIAGSLLFGVACLIVGILGASTPLGSLVVLPIRLFTLFVSDEVAAHWKPDTGNVILFGVIIAFWSVLFGLARLTWQLAKNRRAA
jgi:hypothetical protein